MGSAEPHRVFRMRDNPSPAWTLLVQLAEAQDALLEEMAQLDAVTRGPLPERSALASCRWRLSQASLRRRSLSARSLDFLGHRVAGAEQERLAAFRLADQRMLQGSARHVHAWTIESITANWAGYCEASREIRARMAEHVALERRLVCPVLERLAG